MNASEPGVCPGMAMGVMVGTPEAHGLAFREHEIAIRAARRVGRLVRRRSRRVDQIPIGGRRADFRAVALLEVPRAAEVVRVAMAEQHVLHVCRVEPQRLQPRDDDGFHAVGIAGIDEDDALRRDDRVHRRLGVADGVDVVEQLDGLELRRGRAVPTRVARDAVEGERRLQPRVAAGERPCSVDVHQRLRIVRPRRRGWPAAGPLRGGDAGRSRENDRRQQRQCPFHDAPSLLVTRRF